MGHSDEINYRNSLSVSRETDFITDTKLYLSVYLRSPTDAFDGGDRIRHIRQIWPSETYACSQRSKEARRKEIDCPIYLLNVTNEFSSTRIVFNTSTRNVKIILFKLKK